MQDDPVRYWQELTDNYRQMSDGELLELAANPDELTDVARQVLRDEMKKRELGEPGAANAAERQPSLRLDRPATVTWEQSRARYSPPLDDSDESDHEYTWKTFLCECNSREEALQIGLVLKEAGIDSWISLPDLSFGLGGPRVQVAADQLDQAQAIMANYVPPAPVKQDEEDEVPEFVLPTCPKCGSKEDVVLESADPVNSWLCEACGAEWADAGQAATTTEET